jgi:hypothetical protein
MWLNDVLTWDIKATDVKASAHTDEDKVKVRFSG